MTVLVKQTITATMPAGTVAKVVGGSATLDSGNVPYGRVEVELPLTTDTNLEPVDPRNPGRVIVSAVNTGEWSTSWTPWVEQRRNRMTQPNPTTWPAARLTLTFVTDPTDGQFVRGVVSAVGGSYFNLIGTTWRTPVTPGTVLTASADVRGATGATTAAITLYWHDAAGAVISASTVTGANFALGAAWVRAYVTGTAPANAATVGTYLIMTGSTPVGATIEARRMLWEFTPDVLPYFDGDTIPVDTDTEKYAWTGTANASASIYQTREGSPLFTPDPPRTFDVGLRSRAVDHRAKTVRLSCATDEALAQDYTALVQDRGALAYQSSLRAVCNYVLGKIPTIAGNRIQNPDFDSSIDGWATTGTTTLSWSPTAGGGGAGALVASVSATGTIAITGPWVNVQEGQTVTLSGSVRGTGSPSTIVGRTVRIRATYLEGGTQTNGTPVALTASFQRISATVPAVPKGQTKVRIDLVVEAGTPVGNFALDQVQVQDGPLTPWQNGILFGTSPDANMTAYWEVTNLMPNPALRASVGNWIAGGSNGSLVRVAGLTADLTPMPRIPGVADVTTGSRTTWTGASGDGQGGAYAQSGTVVPYATIRPRTVYTVSCYAMSITDKWVDLKVQLFGSDGAVLESGRKLTTVLLPANVWTRVMVTFESPANAARIGPFLYRQEGLQWAAGDTLYTSGWMVYEGDRDIPYFDASTPWDAGYTYTATGAANASASTRNPKIDRPVELYDWNPGVTAWDFLQPLISLAGFRLFCDEARVWRLIDPATYTVSGVVTLEPGNLTDGIDTIERDAAEVFATGVIVRYTWRDVTGISKTAYDVAGTPEKAIVFDYARAYPGKGAAKAILARRNGTGRVQDVTGIADWTVKPGKQASISLPGAPEAVGKVTVVDYALDDTALMTVATTGLVDIVPNSIDDLDGTIDGLTGTIDELIGSVQIWQ